MVLDLNFILKVGLALLTAAVLAFAVTPLVKKLAQKVGAIDVPTDDRRMHHTPIPRMGGLAIFIAFLTSVLIFAKIDTEIRGILLGAVIIVILGVLDDIMTLHALPKFGVQIVAAVVVGGTSLLGGEGSIFGTIIGAIVLTSITNIMNLLMIDSAWQNLVVGVVILLMVWIDVFTSSKRTKKAG